MLNPNLKEVIWCREQGNNDLLSWKKLRLNTADPMKAIILEYLRKGDGHDDRYFWNDDLLRCVDNYNVRLPEDFRTHILENYKKRNQRMLALRMIRKVTIDLHISESMCYHIELDRTGNILYTTPGNRIESYKMAFFSGFDSYYFEELKEMFINGDDGIGLPDKKFPHWEVDFYTVKGLFHKLEGWPKEESWRRETFCEFLKTLEEIVGIKFGSQFLTAKEAGVNQIQYPDQAVSGEALPLADDELERLSVLAEKLLWGSVKQRAGRNVMISPVSLLTILAIASAASGGNSRKQIESFTDFESEEIWKAAASIDNKTLSGNRSVFSSSGLYFAQSVSGSVNSEFIESIMSDFNARQFNSENPVQEINEWVRNCTRYMIPSIISDRSALGDIVLINALAFEDKWRRRYDVWDIDDGIFHDIDGCDEEVVMLHSTEAMYVFDHNVHGFIKPYKKSGFSFMAIVPYKPGDPSALLMSDKPGIIRRLYRSAITAEVAVTIPEFRFDDQISAKSILEDYGVKDVFIPGEADVSKLLAAENACFSDIIHKTHIELNRSGTKAAAVTALAAAAGSTPELDHFEVKLDRPFWFAIIHSTSGISLFEGIVYYIKKEIK